MNRHLQKQVPVFFNFTEIGRRTRTGLYMKTHYYKTTMTWTGNTGKGTADYRSYDRDHIISVDGKPVIEGSSDPTFRGNKTKYNPEELLVSSLSACHMLQFLHLCTKADVVVVEYTDNAEGIMEETANGGGHFTSVSLKPHITILGECPADKLNDLHRQANQLCFIAQSCNFPVYHAPVYTFLLATH